MTDTAPQTLLGRAREGDREALGRLLEAYRNYLRLLARLRVGRRLRGKIDESDLVQETYLKAHGSFGQFRGVTERELMPAEELAPEFFDLARS